MRTLTVRGIFKRGRWQMAERKRAVKELSESQRGRSLLQCPLL